VRRLSFGAPEEKREAAGEVAALARSDERMKRLLPELGVVPPLLAMLADARGGAAARLAAAGALLELARGTHRLVSGVSGCCGGACWLFACVLFSDSACARAVLDMLLRATPAGRTNGLSNENLISRNQKSISSRGSKWAAILEALPNLVAFYLDCHLWAPPILFFLHFLPISISPRSRPPRSPPCYRRRYAAGRPSRRAALPAEAPPLPTIILLHPLRPSRTLFRERSHLSPLRRPAAILPHRSLGGH
jgi:hypothetical protein